MDSRTLNIHNMVNKSRGDMAYTLVDVDSQVKQTVIDAISDIEGVLAVENLWRDQPAHPSQPDDA